MKTTFMLAAGLALFALGAQAAEINVYPGAKMEKAEMKSTAAAMAKLAPKVRKLIGVSTIYTTTDGFDKVYAYYKKLYPETAPELKKNKVKISTGQIVSEAYFCLDSAKTFDESKHYLMIQSPRAAIYPPNTPKNARIPLPTTLIQFTDRR
jgi:hypothetical protein